MEANIDALQSQLSSTKFELSNAKLQASKFEADTAAAVAQRETVRGEYQTRIDHVAAIGAEAQKQLMLATRVLNDMRAQQEAGWFDLLWRGGWGLARFPDQVFVIELTDRHAVTFRCVTLSRTSHALTLRPDADQEKIQRLSTAYDQAQQQRAAATEQLQQVCWTPSRLSPSCHLQATVALVP